MKTLSAALLSLTALVAVLPAQTQEPSSGQQTTFGSKAEEVTIDVVVRDKKGRLVNDLKQSDFTVTDNGQQKTISSFRVVSGSEAITGTGAHTQLDPLRQVRLITLVFQGGDNESKSLERNAALDLVKGELAQNIYVSVMTIDHKLQAIQPFTNDRELLRKAINRATASVSDFTSDTIHVRAELETMLGPFQGGDPSTIGRTSQLGASAGSSANGPGSTGPNGGAEANAAMASLMLNVLLNAQADESTDAARNSIFPLLDLVKEQYRLPGRKTILYFTMGFPISQGTEDPFKSIVSIANRANVSFYAVDTHGLRTSSTASAANDALRNASAASATQVSSSTTGISMSEAQSVDQALDAGARDTQNTLNRLASETGGTLLANTNDFRGPLRKIVEDAESYYEITYNPNIEKYDGSFRRIAVKTDVADLRIQSRAGYFALPPGASNAGPVVSSFDVPLLMSLDAKPLPHDFGFQSTALHFRPSDTTPCEVVIDIPMGQLSFQEKKEDSSFNSHFAWVVVIKDSAGQIVKKLGQEVPLRVSSNKVAEYKAASHFIYNERVSLKSGRYVLESAVMDLNAQTKSARKSSFVVPEKTDGLSMSSVAVIRSVKAKDQSIKPDDPLLASDKVVTPTVDPVLKKTEITTIPFFLTLYPNPKNTAKPELLMEFSKDGTMLGSGKAPLSDVDSEGRIQYVANAPAASLPPGNYIVRFVASQGTEQTSESVSFTVE